MQIRLLAAAVAAAALAACASGNATIPAAHDAASTLNSSGLTTLSAFTARDAASGTLVHILPTREALKDARDNGRAPMAGSSNLLYGGGPVQTNPKLYVVFWGSSWGSFTGDPAGVAARLKSFYGVIGGSAWLNTVTQYYQSNGAHVGNSGNIFMGSYIDSSSTPPTHPTQSQLAVEASKAAAHFGDYSINAGYVVALPHGISPSGFGTQYCAYHGTTTAGGTSVAWTNLPYIPDAGTSCGAGSVNSGGTLDGVTIIAGAQQAEVETAPTGNGWLDSSGEDLTAKCARVNLIDNPAAGGYPTQPLWSNATSSCVQSYP